MARALHSGPAHAGTRQQTLPNTVHAAVQKAALENAPQNRAPHV